MDAGRFATTIAHRTVGPDELKMTFTYSQGGLGGQIYFKVVTMATSDPREEKFGESSLRAKYFIFTYYYSDL